MFVGCLQTTQTTSTRNARIPKKETRSSATVNVEEDTGNQDMITMYRLLNNRQCSARYTDVQLVYLLPYLIIYAQWLI